MLFLENKEKPCVKIHLILIHLVLIHSNVQSWNRVDLDWQSEFWPCKSTLITDHFNSECEWLFLIKFF